MPIPSIRRIALAASAAVLLAVPATVVSAPAASAAPYPPGTGPMVLSSTTSFAGGPLSFVGTSFAPGEPLAARLTVPVRTGAGQADPTLLGVVHADPSGVARGTVTIPRNTRTGIYSFSLTGSNSGLYLSAYITVTGLPGGPGDPGHPGGPGHPGHPADPGHPGRGRADSAAVDIDTAPVANQVTQPENGPGRTLAAAGAVAALGAFGGGAYLMRRRRRA
ncbi:hypothetical protein [Actinacidiphila oryziradicis]|uniref:hypothetical protein n=1 Tax=Actinacidiphila oryziradicis TaxID=2571141 RepID=UPI001B80B7F2|nr:hypothetical protein [Actinacidiphila oryziradicis]